MRNNHLRNASQLARIHRVTKCSRRAGTAELMRTTWHESKSRLPRRHSGAGAGLQTSRIGSSDSLDFAFDGLYRRADLLDCLAHSLRSDAKFLRPVLELVLFVGVDSAGILRTFFCCIVSH